MSTRFRRLTDLFVTGLPAQLPDGTHIWIQALNSYQQDECRSDAQVARARLIMALREKGEEREKIEARFYEFGREHMISELADTRAKRKMADYVDAMRSDPEWKERLEILTRTDIEDTATPLTPDEVALLAQVNQEVLSELTTRESDENAFQVRRLEPMSDEDLITEWTEQWLESRGGEIAQGEYRLTEIWYATRWCNALAGPDGELDHSGCEGHGEKVFATRQDVRDVPGPLLQLIADTQSELNLAGRDPKGSGSAANSSNSSSTPNEPADSTPSTSTATPAPPPGT